MADFFQGIFAMIFLGHFLYIIYFLILLLPMFSQILFLHLIKIEELWKLAITIFAVEGLIIPISNILSDISFSFEKSNIFMILALILLILILSIISIFICKTSNKINIKRTLLFISSFSVNIGIIILMILKFNLFN